MLFRSLVAEPAAWRGPGAPPLDLALTPTLWTENGIVVLASTREAAAAIVARAGQGRSEPSGDQLMLHGPAIAAWIADHRRVLQLARMLDEGEDAGDAAGFYDAVLAIAAALRTLAVHVQCDEATTRASLTAERAR